MILKIKINSLYNSVNKKKLNYSVCKATDYTINKFTIIITINK